MVTVRPGTETDRPRLRAIQSAALAEPAPELLDLALTTDVSRALVLEDERPVGYAIVLSSEEGAYVPEIAIEPSRQREGLGALLLVRVCEALADEGVETVRLTARASDERVHSFYERQGFTRVDRLTDRFESGDGVVFERRL